MRILWIVVCCLVGSMVPALAEPCPGNPDALGTSRTLTVDAKTFPRIGTMQYPASLPLNDHEVVITFDDGVCQVLPCSLLSQFSTDPVSRRRVARS